MFKAIKTLLLIAVLCLIPASAQKLKMSGRLNKPANTTFSIDSLIEEEGSYRFERADAVNSNVWTVVTNVVALPGKLTLSEPVGLFHRFYRLLRLTNAPVVTLQPIGVTNFAPAEVKLSTVVTGAAPMRFRWYRDGRAIDGAIGTNLFFAGRTDLSGNYSLVATNPWGSVTSSVAAVKIQNAVAPTISGRSIRFVITGLQGDFTTSGEYTTSFNPLGFYTTSGSSFFLNDAGNWQYGIVNEGVARISLPGSIIYPNGTMSLGFQSLTSGSYVLVVPGFNGSQSGTFQILD